MLKKISSNKMFGGFCERYQHYSKTLHVDMNFSIYLPPQTLTGLTCPVVYWLSGLTCTDENFMIKSGAQRLAAELGLVIVCPDTSPRGLNVPDDENQCWDFGLGASFYVNATQAPWKTHYQMYDYVVDELPQLVEKNFNVNARRAISGHSMGGHGALVCALRNSSFYCSVSAFSPITAPSNSPWGKKAFSHYLGADQEAWNEWDANFLLRQAEKNLPILIDQGDADEFLSAQLKPDTFLNTAEQKKYPITLRMQHGYDHSYFFVASFIDEHLKFHKQHLVEL